MNSKLKHKSSPPLKWAAALLAAATLSATAQTISNPSFEAELFTVFPGYISGNTEITDWSANNPDRVGLNPAETSPFANNGTIPDGNNVAFIQSTPEGTSLSTFLTGLTAGERYMVNFRVNARSGQTPNLKISIDDIPVLNTGISAVTEAHPYKFFAFEFTAAAEGQTMTLLNDADGDHTVLVDAFSIAPSTTAWSYAPWNDDGDSGVDSTKQYTHAFSFGSAAGTLINGIPFTGVGGGNPSSAGSFSVTGSPNVFNNDANNVTGGSRQLANDFIYGIGTISNLVQSITIEGLTPGTEYRATIYSIGWENGTRAATFSVGEDRLTVNQDHFGDNNGILFIYDYVASDTSITLNYMPLQGNTIHTYGFSNYEVSTPVPVSITRQPASQWVPQGETATFTVVAAGSAPISYQWLIDGVEIPDETNAVFSLEGVSPFEVGVYSVIVSNALNTVTSEGARLEVSLNTLVNPSFEADTFSAFPGYVNGNTPITGWTSLGDHGINPGTTFTPFADNGTIPHGNQVAFMQGNGPLSQSVSGFVVGQDYYIGYYENARTGATVPSIEVTVDGVTVVPTHPRPPVGGVNPYVRMVSDVFTANAETIEIAFIKSNPQGGDTTALIDHVNIIPIEAGTPPTIATQPQSLTVNVGDAATFTVQPLGSPPFSFQWFKDGVEIEGATDRTFSIPFVSEPDEAAYSVVVSNSAGDATSADAVLTVFEPIPDLFNTGVDNDHALLPDGAEDPHYTLIENADGVEMSALAQSPIPGSWLANSTISRWVGPRVNTVDAAGGRYVYRTTFNIVDRDPATGVIRGRWASDNPGLDILVNGVSTGNPQSPAFTAYTAFEISSANATLVPGTNTIDFVVENTAVGYTGLRVEFLMSNLDIPPGVPPEITAQPQDQNPILGDSASFSVAATGSAPLSYAWQKDGVVLEGQTSPTLTLSSVTLDDVGDYSVTVSNPAGTAVSESASLTISFSRVEGVVFGTGVDDTGTPLANGEIDLHYTLISSADPSFPPAGSQDAIVTGEASAPIPPWLASSSSSKWIAPQVDQSAGSAEGDYTYQTWFDLGTIDPARFLIAGRWAMDNTGVDILLNGASLGITGSGFGAFTPFTIAGGFLPGINTLDFIINNAPPTPNPTGLRVELDGLLTLSTATVLSIARQDDQLVISWAPVGPCQELESAENLEGPWTPVTATSPYTVDPSTPDAKFFRVATRPNCHIEF